MIHSSALPRKKNHPRLIVKKQSLFSKVMKSIKNYGKRGLRALLLSKTFHIFFKFTVSVAVVYAAFYGLYTYINNSVANDVVVSKSEIIARVGKLITLPNTEPEAVVRVEDAATLKKQNSFYENVKEGDYIVMYPKIAIVYDLRNNTIVATKEVK